MSLTLGDAFHLGRMPGIDFIGCFGISRLGVNLVRLGQVLLEGSFQRRRDNDGAFDVPHDPSQIIADHRDHLATAPHLPGSHVFVGHKHGVLAFADIALSEFHAACLRPFD